MTEENKDYSKLNIFQKMSEVTNLIGRVKKNLTVKVSEKQQYKAVSEVDIITEVKEAEYKVGIYSYPLEREIIKDDIITTTSQYGEKNTFHIRLKTIYRFINIHNPQEYIEITSYSDGMDSGDKGFGKAMTYGDKYALMKAYKIETGDDPDKEASQEFKKYSAQKNIQNATDKQIEIIKQIYSEDELKTMLERLKLKDIKEITIAQASKMISSRKGNNDSTSTR